MLICPAFLKQSRTLIYTLGNSIPSLFSKIGKVKTIMCRPFLVSKRYTNYRSAINCPMHIYVYIYFIIRLGMFHHHHNPVTFHMWWIVYQNDCLAFLSKWCRRSFNSYWPALKSSWMITYKYRSTLAYCYFSHMTCFSHQILSPYIKNEPIQY